VWDCHNAGVSSDMSYLVQDSEDHKKLCGTSGDR